METAINAWRQFPEQTRFILSCGTEASRPASTGKTYLKTCILIATGLAKGMACLGCVPSPRVQSFSEILKYANSRKNHYSDHERWKEIATGLAANQANRKGLNKATGKGIFNHMTTVIAEKLDRKLTTWDAVTVQEVEHLVAEIIDLADADGLDLLRDRQVEQEVMDILDEDTSR